MERRQAPRVNSIRVCSDPQGSLEAHRPTDQNQTPPRSQQIPKMVSVVITRSLNLREIYHSGNDILFGKELISNLRTESLNPSLLC
jgi:hypothetical protein